MKMKRAEPETKQHILVGAKDALPDGHVWREGGGYAIYAAEQPRSSWQRHSHECVQVTIGLEPAHVQSVWGAGEKLASQRELSGNMISVIPAGELHATMWQRRAALVHLYLETDFLEGIAARLTDYTASGLRTVHLGRDVLLEELGRWLFRECVMYRGAAKTTDAAVETLVVHLLRNYSQKTRTIAAGSGALGPARERKIREYVEREIEGDLSIGELARIAGMNPQYFANAFRKTTGFTPHRYVCQRRVARAQQRLLETDASLVEIAGECGFKNQSQFTTTFRQYTGVTPGRFRLTNGRND